MYVQDRNNRFDLRFKTSEARPCEKFRVSPLFVHSPVIGLGECLQGQVYEKTGVLKCLSILEP